MRVLLLRRNHTELMEAGQDISYGDQKRADEKIGPQEVLMPVGFLKKEEPHDLIRRE